MTLAADAPPHSAALAVDALERQHNQSPAASAPNVLIFCPFASTLVEESVTGNACFFEGHTQLKAVPSPHATAAEQSTPLKSTVVDEVRAVLANALIPIEIVLLDIFTKASLVHPSNACAPIVCKLVAPLMSMDVISVIPANAY
jgi:hypothetical protein